MIVLFIYLGVLFLSLFVMTALLQNNYIKEILACDGDFFNAYISCVLWPVVFVVSILCGLFYCFILLPGRKLGDKLNKVIEDPKSFVKNVLKEDK